MEKALEKDLQAGKFKFGGSTVSQQLARNLYLSPEKSLLRKGAEALITWRMERVLSKRRILELYLNEVEWGEGIFGAEATARHYLGKSASELDPREAARMAAVLPNPRKYNPTGEQRYVVNRSKAIYNIMIRREIVAPQVVGSDLALRLFLLSPSPFHLHTFIKKQVSGQDPLRRKANRS